MPTIYNIASDSWVNVVVSGTGTIASVPMIVITSAATSTNATTVWFMGQDSAYSQTSATTSYSYQQQSMMMMLAQQQVARANAYHQSALASQQSPHVRAERERHAATLQSEREAARSRARDLLLDHLTPAQRATVEANGWFLVRGGKTKRDYRVHTDQGVAGNVYELDARGRPVMRLCGHATRDIPDHDHFLAQKMMLEHEEHDYCRLANRTSMR